MKHVKLYHKKSHLFATFLVILLPFIFILLFGTISLDAKVNFLYDLLLSSIRLVIAFVISIIIAVVLGITLSRGKLGDFFLPVFDVLQSFPTFAMLPLAIYWFGPSNFTVIFFLILTMIWPILFAIISSQKLIKNEWDEAATLFGATGWKRLRYVALPISYPALITGAIVGLGEGWEAVVGGEIVVQLQQHGLGKFFGEHGTSGELVFFGVTALLLFIFSMNKLVFLPLLERSHKVMTE